MTDGHLIKTLKGMMVLYDYELGGVDIPQLCYHSLLSITKNCRMYLVEVEKILKSMESCDAPALHGN